MSGCPRWATAEARELAAAAAVDDAEMAVRAFARRLVDEHGVGALPVRLSAFFSWAGIRKVRREDMPLEGALRRLDDGRFDILVREGAPPPRQRFSVAHELGHVLFYRYAPHSKALQAQRNERAPSEEERLCNVAAEEILMPSAFVADVLRRFTGAGCVLELASQCDVSIEAAILRLAPLWPGRGEIQMWRQISGDWSPILVRGLARTRRSLVSFGIDEWAGRRFPTTASSAWTGGTSLYSRAKRMCIPARTSVLPVPRRTPTVLILHEIVNERGDESKTELERAAADRIRRAWAAPARRDCPACSGAGVLYPDPRQYPANRNERVRACPCRFEANPQVLSA